MERGGTQNSAPAELGCPRLDKEMPDSKEELRRFLMLPNVDKKKKYFRELFDNLAGHDIPLEALELCFGRNNLGLRDNQLRLMAMFSAIFDTGNNEEAKVYYEKRNMLQFLTESHFCKFLIRIILIKPKKSTELTTFTNNLHYYCLNMLQYITDERYIEKKKDRVKNFVLVKKHEAFGRLVDFLDLNIGTPLIKVHASAVLKQFVAEHEEASALLIKTSCLKKCLFLMTRKQCEKMFVNYYRDNYLTKSSFDKDENEAIENFYHGKQTVLRRNERFPILTENDHKMDCFMYMAQDVQTNCAIVIYKLLSADLLLRKDTLMSKPFAKVINKWLWTPCIWKPERPMFHLCFNILRQVVEDCQYLVSSQVLIKNYNILELIQDQIYNPDKDILTGVINLLGVFLRQYPECRKRVYANEVITNAVVMYINSYDEQVQVGALQTLCAYAQLPGTAELVIQNLGITAEKMFLLTKYNIDGVRDVLQQMKIFMQQNCRRVWQQTTDAVRKVCFEKKYCLGRALRHKEDGNQQFKEKNYEAALKCYTLGLECVPPFENFGKEHIPRKSNWFVLPSVLFSNRAQCYLTMKKWQETIEDCTQAIVRSFEDNEEANKILYKTVYRRAKAFVEIQDYRNALNDVSFCLQQNLPATNVRSLFREVLTEYRKRFGIEPLRRCGACMDGLATKLKRCAKCPEVYCSRECQIYAWDEGHKNLCNYSLGEGNSG